MKNETASHSIKSVASHDRKCNCRLATGTWDYANGLQERRTIINVFREEWMAIYVVRKGKTGEEVKDTNRSKNK